VKSAEHRALRTEDVVCDTRDFGVGPASVHAGAQPLDPGRWTAALVGGARRARVRGALVKLTNGRGLMIAAPIEE